MTNAHKDLMQPGSIKPGTFSLAVVLAGAGVALSSRIVSPLTAPTALEDGVVLITWWACALLSAWLVGSVLMWRLAMRSSSRRLTTFTKRIAMPGTRKLAESTFALSLILGAGACSIGPTTEAPTLSFVGTAPEQPTTTFSSATTSTSEQPSFESPSVDNSDAPDGASGNRPPNQEYPEGQTSDGPESPTESPAETPNLPAHYEVRSGDNLWSIAQQTLQARLEDEPTTSQVGTYWRQLVLASRDSIASGNPNLIYPGEILTLPELELAG